MRPRRDDDGPPLGARRIMDLIGEIGRSQRTKHPRVAYKRTDKGDHCVALIWEGWLPYEDQE